jgi:transcriptional regulator with XRE-family HTH domain
MAKFLQKIEARKLRSQGKSVNDIARDLEVSKSTVSIWCRDINLSKKQIDKLIASKEKGITLGRLKGAAMQRQKRLDNIKSAEDETLNIKKISDKEFWFFGLALYLAEGSKNTNRVQFTNSDKRIIYFMLLWFKRFYGISASDIRCSILINESHKNREDLLKNFWSRYLGVSLDNFTPIRYTRSSTKKIYENHDNYFGTFSFRINKSSVIMYKISALMDRILAIKLGVDKSAKIS